MSILSSKQITSNLTVCSQWPCPSLDVFWKSQTVQLLLYFPYSKSVYIVWQQWHILHHRIANSFIFVFVYFIYEYIWLFCCHILGIFINHLFTCILFSLSDIWILALKSISIIHDILIFLYFCFTHENVPHTFLSPCIRIFTAIYIHAYILV